MRKLSGKTINSLALCMALAAPLVYLFGTLFMYLAGAHGNMNLANDETETRILRNNAFQRGYKASEINYEELDNDTRFATTSVFEIENIEYTYIFHGTAGSTSQFRVYYYDSEGLYLDYNMKIQPTGTFTYTPISNAKYVRYAIYRVNAGELNSDYMNLDYMEIHGYSRSLIRNDQYLFGQFFSTDNFLADSGRKVLRGTPLYGFEPIGELIRYTDENMLHLANLSYGPLVIGYTYYCAHVIIVDLIFYIGSFIPRLIKKTINKLEGGLD